MSTDTDITPRPVSLTVTRQGEQIFSHSGSWLHPLLDLQKYLEETRIDPAGLFLQDKVVGKAAALLIVGMGFRKVKALTLSALGKGVFETHNIDYEYDTLVDSILCRTEQMLAETGDPLEARRIIEGLLQAPR